MTQVTISNEPNTNKPRGLNVNLTNVSVLYSIDLLNDDESIIIKGAESNLNVGNVVMPGETNDNKELKDALISDIEEAFVKYLTAINK